MRDLAHIVYVSEATVDFSDKDVRKLLERARGRNAALGVSGILLLAGRSFFQVLEGAAGAVEEVFERVRLDTRHKRVVVLVREPIQHRDFEAWSMGLARVASKDLASLPGLSDFFATRKTLENLEPGMGRTLLEAFRDGRFRAHVGD